MFGLINNWICSLKYLCNKCLVNVVLPERVEPTSRILIPPVRLSGSSIVSGLSSISLYSIEKKTAETTEKYFLVVYNGSPSFNAG